MAEDTAAVQDEPADPSPNPPRAPAIDIDRLAEKVYRLMQADARLALARGQRALGARQWRAGKG